MSTYPKIKVTEVAYHRNGVCGVGFYAVMFTCTEDGIAQPMVATVFPDYDDEGERVRPFNPRVAVLDLDLLSGDDATVAFGTNSFRGDYFAPVLYDAIDAYEAQRAVSA